MSTLKTGLLYVPRLKMTNGLPTKPLREREQMEYTCTCMRKENGSYTVYVIHVYEGKRTNGNYISERNGKLLVHVYEEREVIIIRGKENKRKLYV